MNPRRLLLITLGASLSANTALLRAQTPSGAMRRVGVLSPSTRTKDEITLKPFFDQMRQLGWVEGQSISYDRVNADDQMASLPRLAGELAARRPEVIFASPTPAAVAAKQATQTIPIVFAAVSDPVGIGLVSNLARPMGNLTGLANLFDSLAPKRLELLREILPGARRLGRLVDPSDPSFKLDQQALTPLTDALHLTLVSAEATNPVEFDAAVAKLIGDRVDAIVIGGVSPLASSLRARLIELANQKRVPVVGGNVQFAEAGALFSYGTSLADQLRRAAMLVDKILKGARPADIPVEQPTLFELVVNWKAAKALGISVPRSFLLRADRVIE